jgi:hypothetical protein
MSSPENLDELRHKTLSAQLAASAEARSKMLLDKANGFAETALGVASNAHERSLALEALGLCALWDYRGDDAWRNLSHAVDERIAAGRAAGEGFAMLCARAVEPPTRWPGSMSQVPTEAEVAPYVEIGMAHAELEGEARIRLLIAKALWPFAFRKDGFTDDEADAARIAGEKAADLALGLERLDLASAALDGVGGIEFIRGYHGRNDEVIKRRLEIVECLSDPWEVGDALQTAADHALWVGHYTDAVRWADEGFERSRSGPDVWRACLAWRAIARSRLGDWDEALEDIRLLEEAPASTRFGSAAYFHVAARSCAALLHELRGERAASDRFVSLAGGESLGTGTVRQVPWLARLVAHRGGSDDEALHWLDRSEVVSSNIATPAILEARCDVVALLERWDLADETIGESRDFVELARVDALALYADRLEGAAALARGHGALAVEALTRAREGFAALSARWEEALSALWLAEALRVQGSHAEARATAEAASAVFDELRSVREHEHARSLLASM